MRPTSEDRFNILHGITYINQSVRQSITAFEIIQCWDITHNLYRSLANSSTGYCMKLNYLIGCIMTPNTRTWNLTHLYSLEFLLVHQSYVCLVYDFHTLAFKHCRQADRDIYSRVSTNSRVSTIVSTIKYSWMTFL